MESHYVQARSSLVGPPAIIVINCVANYWWARGPHGPTLLLVFKLWSIKLRFGLILTRKNWKGGGGQGNHNCSKKKKIRFRNHLVELAQSPCSHWNLYLTKSQEANDIFNLINKYNKLLKFHLKRLIIF